MCLISETRSLAFYHPPGVFCFHTAEADSKLTATLTEHLFQRPGKSFGSDLAARNIQRGRDHKIATYGMVR